MLQFERYSAAQDPVAAELVKLVDRFNGEKDAPSPALIDALRAWIRHTPTHPKALAIYARMVFWGCIDYASARADLAPCIDAAAFNAMEIGFKEELVACLGRRLLHELTGLAFTDIDYYLDHCLNAPRAGTAARSSETWYYQPPKSGFFSVIENIVMAKFVCHFHGRRFLLDNSPGWWPYPTSFQDIFASLFDEPPRSADENLAVLPFAMMREFVAKGSRQVVEAYVQFKWQEYARIREALLDKVDEPRAYFESLRESAVFYVRGGDKLLYETILPPDARVRNDLEMLFRRAENLFVLSDDYQLAQRYVGQLGAGRAINLTRQDFNGYYLARASDDDVKAIVRNYLILASAKYSMSCPSSNLVNSAHWSNPILAEQLPLQSIPILRYIFV